MSVRTENSEIGINSELLLFDPPIINAGIERIYWVDCRPVNQLTEDGSVDFVISGAGSEYIDLKRSIDSLSKLK